MIDKPVLTIEHVAAYLPFQVKILTSKGVKIPKRLDIEPLYVGRDPLWTRDISAVKLILRPMSEAKCFLNNREIYHADDLFSLNAHIDSFTVGIYNILIKNKFDVFNLISKGLAVSCHDVGVSYD